MPQLLWTLGAPPPFHVCLYLIATHTYMILKKRITQDGLKGLSIPNPPPSPCPPPYCYVGRILLPCCEKPSHPASPVNPNSQSIYPSINHTITIGALASRFFFPQRTPSSMERARVIEKKKCDRWSVSHWNLIDN